MRTSSSLPEEKKWRGYSKWQHNGLKVGSFPKNTDGADIFLPIPTDESWAISENSFEEIDKTIAVEKVFPAFGTIARIRPFINLQTTDYSRDMIEPNGTKSGNLYSLWRFTPDEESSLMKDFWIYLPSSKSNREDLVQDDVVSLNNGSYAIQKFVGSTARREDRLMSAKKPYGIDFDTSDPDTNLAKARDTLADYNDMRNRHGKENSGEGEERDVGYGRWYRLKPEKNSTIKDKVTEDIIIKKGNKGEPLWVDEKTFVGNKDMRDHLEYYLKEENRKSFNDVQNDLYDSWAEKSGAIKSDIEEVHEGVRLLSKAAGERGEDYGILPRFRVEYGKTDGILHQNSPMEMMIDGKVFDTVDGIFENKKLDKYPQMKKPEDVEDSWWLNKVDMTEYKDMPVYSSTLNSMRRPDSKFHIDEETDLQDVNWAIGRNFKMRGEDYLIDGESRQNGEVWTHGYDVLDPAEDDELFDTERGIWTPWSMVWANIEGGKTNLDGDMYEDSAFYLGSQRALNENPTSFDTFPTNEGMLADAIDGAFGGKYTWESKKHLLENFPATFMGLRKYHAMFNVQNAFAHEKIDEGYQKVKLNPSMWSDRLYYEKNRTGVRGGVGPGANSFALASHSLGRYPQMKKPSNILKFLNEEERTLKHIAFAQNEARKKAKARKKHVREPRKSQLADVRLF